MTPSSMIEIVGVLMAAWFVGFCMGHLIKFYRNLIHSI